MRDSLVQVSQLPFPPFAIASISVEFSVEQGAWLHRTTPDRLPQARWASFGSAGSRLSWAGGNGHRPWRSANYADRWRRVPDQ